MKCFVSEMTKSKWLLSLAMKGSKPLHPRTPQRSSVVYSICLK